MIQLRSHLPGALILIATAASCFAQPASETAGRKSAEWERLAKTLDSRIARMAPCDPKVKEAIEEVSRASAARLAALSEVMKAAVDQSKAEIVKLQAALSAEEAVLGDVEVERSEARQERIAIDTQLADLNDSARRRQSLDQARTVLADIDAKTSRRASLAEQQAQVRGSLALAMRDLQSAMEARQRSLANEQSALTLETSRWSEYYAARAARAQTECSITAPAAPRANKKKASKQR